MNKEEIKKILYKASKFAEKRAYELEDTEYVDNYKRAALCQDMFTFLYLAIDN